jgi:undecaprenyl-diphosphatase
MDAVVGALVGLPPWLVLGLVFLLPALEASVFVGLVVPGEIVIVIGGVVAHGGGLPLWSVIVAAAAGAVIGDQVGYLVGRRFGPGLVARLPARARRSGEVDRVLDVLRRRGAPAVALGRWVAALRALVPGLAGMSGMRRLPFTVANVLGGAPWATTVAVLGYLAGASYRALEQRLGLGSEIAFGVLVVVGLVVWWRVRRTRATARW